MRSILLLSFLFSIVYCSIQINTIASGFTWAENLIFDGNGNLFVTDVTRGEIYRIYASDTSGNYTLEPFLSNQMDHVLGLAMSQDSSKLYSVGKTKKTKENVVIQMNPKIPQQFQVIAKLPKTIGNGLALHFASNCLYSASEGNFLPSEGVVYKIDLNRNNSVSIVMQNLYAADGAWIDQMNHLLYISQVIGSKVLVFDIMKQKELYSYTPSYVQMLDDYCLSSDNSQIIGADFYSGNIVQFSTDPNKSSATQIIASHLTNPTSVRFGRGKGFDSNSIYVTEGGSIFAKSNSRRVLQIKL